MLGSASTIERHIWTFYYYCFKGTKHMTLRHRACQQVTRGAVAVQGDSRHEMRLNTASVAYPTTSGGLSSEGECRKPYVGHRLASKRRRSP